VLKAARHHFRGCAMCSPMAAMPGIN
jgi:hypothetical protein